MKSIVIFYDAALAMIADLELYHGVELANKESKRLQIALAETAFKVYCNSKKGAVDLRAHLKGGAK